MNNKTYYEGSSGTLYGHEPGNDEDLLETVPYTWDKPGTFVCDGLGVRTALEFNCVRVYR